MATAHCRSMSQIEFLDYPASSTELEHKQAGARIVDNIVYYLAAHAPHVAFKEDFWRTSPSFVIV